MAEPAAAWTRKPSCTGACPTTWCCEVRSAPPSADRRLTRPSAEIPYIHCATWLQRAHSRVSSSRATPAWTRNLPSPSTWDCCWIGTTCWPITISLTLHSITGHTTSPIPWSSNRSPKSWNWPVPAGIVVRETPLTCNGYVSARPPAWQTCRLLRSTSSTARTSRRTVSISAAVTVSLRVRATWNSRFPVPASCLLTSIHGNWALLLTRWGG